MNWKPIIQGAFAGLLSAAVIDYAAFRSWKSFDDFRAYAWGLALWRWVQGALVGAITGAGLDLGV